jgi:tetratricopeptide (TPR) repeat protein
MDNLKKFVPLLALIAIIWAGYAIGGRLFISSRISLAETQMLMGEHGEALKTLAFANRFSPNNAELHFQLATVYRRLGKGEDFKAHLAKAAELGYPDKQELHDQELLWIVQSGQHVLEVGQELVNSNAEAELVKSDQIYEALVQGHLASGNTQEAEFVLRGWHDLRVANKPGTPAPRYWLATIFERSADTESAFKLLKELNQEYPYHIQTTAAYARMLLDKNSVDEALRVVEKCREQHPDDKMLIGELIGCYFRLGGSESLKKCEELCDEILEGNPTRLNSSVAYNYRGQIQLKSENPDLEKAVENLEQAVALNPGSNSTLLALTMAYRFVGNKEKADYYNKKTEEFGKMGIRINDLNRELVAPNPDVKKMYETAVILRDLGSDRESAVWLKLILQRDPTHRPSLMELARFYRRQGRPDLAEDILLQAEQLRSVRVQ